MIKKIGILVIIQFHTTSPDGKMTIEKVINFNSCGTTLIKSNRRSYTFKNFPLSSPSSDLTLLSDRIGDYYLVSQGKTRIPGVNDAEEFELLNVSLQTSRIVQEWLQCQCPFLEVI